MCLRPSRIQKYYWPVIIVVVDELKVRLVNDLLINESKITIVSNTEKKDICNQDIKNIPVNKEEFKIIYAGGG